MIDIYHNPRCRKSREALQLLESKKIEHQVVLYLDKPLNFEELSDLIEKLQINPLDLVRKNESIWKEQFKSENLSPNEIIKAMVQHPILIERPIIARGENAVIGRPAEKILTLL